MAGREQPRLDHSTSLPSLCKFGGANPGGPWIYREGGAGVGARGVKYVPRNEAAAIAYAASRKQTLQGQLGTGNKIGSVVQYPVSSKDPFNTCDARKGHLSAEDRRLVRVRCKHHLKKTPGYPDNVYMVENALFRSFAASPELHKAFFQGEDFSRQILDRAALSIGMGGLPPHKKPEPKPGRRDGDALDLKPGHHSYACSPLCCCLMYQDAALGVTSSSREPGLFEETFTNSAKAGATKFLDSLATAVRDKHQHLH